MRRKANFKAFEITEDEYNRLFVTQGGVCAICGGAETYVTKNGHLRNLSIDHCHDTGKIRGLLCQPCNAGIGMLKDDPKLLLKALEYLTK